MFAKHFAAVGDYKQARDHFLKANAIQEAIAMLVVHIIKWPKKIVWTQLGS